MAPSRRLLLPNAELDPTRDKHAYASVLYGAFKNRIMTCLHCWEYGKGTLRLDASRCTSYKDGHKYLYTKEWTCATCDCGAEVWCSAIIPGRCRRDDPQVDWDEEAIKETRRRRGTWVSEGRKILREERAGQNDQMQLGVQGIANIHGSTPSTAFDGSITDNRLRQKMSNSDAMTNFTPQAQYPETHPDWMGTDLDLGLGTPNPYIPQSNDLATPFEFDQAIADLNAYQDPQQQQSTGAGGDRLDVSQLAPYANYSKDTMRNPSPTIPEWSVFQGDNLTIPANAMNQDLQNWQPNPGSYSDQTSLPQSSVVLQLGHQRGHLSDPYMFMFPKPDGWDSSLQSAAPLECHLDLALDIGDRTNNLTAPFQGLSITNQPHSVPSASGGKLDSLTLHPNTREMQPRDDSGGNAIHDRGPNLTVWDDDHETCRQ